MIAIHSFSEVGGHPVNEDAFAVQQHPLDAELRIVIVADGQGGQPGGGPAAERACRAALEAALQMMPKQLLNPLAWPHIVRKADLAVEAEAEAGFTTLVSLCASNESVIGASSGDSAALLLQNQTAVALTAQQRKNPPIGSGMAAPIPFAAPIKAPWQLLTMTDGVWKYASWTQIIDAARQLHGEELIAELQRLARLPATGQFQDDFTVVLLEQE